MDNLRALQSRPSAGHRISILSDSAPNSGPSCYLYATDAFATSKFQMKITYSAATSLDGFIAREDGDVSWLDELNIDSSETGLAEFFAGVDGLVMGRYTYDFVFNYGSWPYEDKPTWVCTHRELQPLDGANLIIAGNIDDVVSDATAKGMEHLWLVGGGRLASSFLAKGLITNVSISEMPIKLESGIPLFFDHKLEDIDSQARSVINKNGFRQIEITLLNDRNIPKSS